MLVIRARLLLVALWAGSLLAVGYLVAPTLFATLPDKALAGTLAGAMLRSEAWLSAGMGVLLMGVLAVSQDLDAKTKRTLRIIVLGMLACVLVNYAGLWPLMAEARAAGDRSRFGMLHGLSMVVYLTQSVMSLYLVIRNKS
ncbi:MAG: DUF4149 domain-containing protein [Pseudomonadota bacterium]